MLLLLLYSKTLCSPFYVCIGVRRRGALLYGICIYTSLGFLGSCLGATNSRERWLVTSISSPKWRQGCSNLLLQQQCCYVMNNDHRSSCTSYPTLVKSSWCGIFRFTGSNLARDATRYLQCSVCVRFMLPFKLFSDAVLSVLVNRAARRPREEERLKPPLKFEGGAKPPWSVFARNTTTSRSIQ